MAEFPRSVRLGVSSWSPQRLIPTRGCAANRQKTRLTLTLRQLLRSVSCESPSTTRWPRPGSCSTRRWPTGRPKLLDLLAPVLPMYALRPRRPVDSHHLGNGFRVDIEKGELYREALDRLERADAWGQVERCLTEATAYQLARPRRTSPADELHVVLLLGDPTDRSSST